MKLTEELTYYYFKTPNARRNATIGASAEYTVKIEPVKCLCGIENRQIVVKKYATRKVIGYLILCPECYEKCKPEERGQE